MLTTASSQKADVRPIAFVLEDGGGPTAPFTLNIRPEELTRNEPSRLTVQQTLGGAWADSFGPGVQQITIAGHTGWRGAATGEDGLELFRRLRSTVFERWHSLRDTAVANGVDPDKVKLLFSNSLDDFVWEVAAANFVLRRSKSRPLLAQYNISMMVLDTSVSRGASLVRTDPLAGLDSLGHTIGVLDALAAEIRVLIGGTLGESMASFSRLTGDVLREVNRVVTAGRGVIDAVYEPLLAVARDMAQAGRNIAQIVAAGPGLIEYARSRMMNLAAAFTNAFCLLKNAFKIRRGLPDFSSIYGASNCSSTSGGTPMSRYTVGGLNPFESVAPTSSSPILQTPAAQAQVSTLSRVDVASPMYPLSALSSMLRDVVIGTSVTVSA